MDTKSSLKSTLAVGQKRYTYYPVDNVPGSEKLPYSLTVLLENILRLAPNEEQAQKLSKRLIEAGLSGEAGDEIEFMPSRVLFQDFTGVPIFVDFAVMREACQELGGDPSKVNPNIPCNLVIDHSVIADYSGSDSALDKNMALEFARNQERYAFLKWAQNSFDNVHIVPPGAGICHQLNIERFAKVVMTKDEAGETLAYFDSLVGSDSHTPTANGIGVLGWGVGGIEAEAAALGQPITLVVPRVIGVELTGELPEGVTAMDLSLTFAQMLRREGVVGSFVECFGPGVANLSATQRTCVSNMTPEYGSTCTLFPVDERTIEYLKLTGREDDQVALVEAYAKKQGLWGGADQGGRVYAKVLKLDLGTVEHNIAGPSRPHDRIPLSGARDAFRKVCSDRKLDLDRTVEVSVGGAKRKLGHGAIAIAAVTSCTTATDPAMMLMAGILAKNAVSAGLTPKPWVKTIFAPGSHTTELMMRRAGLMESLERLGFYTCGFGCMSCIGNSGPLAGPMHDIADQVELASVLSGNRNFEGRISPDVSQNYLASPATVIAYSLVGTMDFDFDSQPLGTDDFGNDVFLADIWPEDGEVQTLLRTTVTRELFDEGGKGLFEGDSRWQALDSSASETFDWDVHSTYVRRAPYFDGMQPEAQALAPITGARAIAVLGDFITTDHISPAGSIAPDSAAAAYLREQGVAQADFNTYGSRRGNHEVMMRGTFANVKLVNQLAGGKKGGWTRDFNDGQVKLIFDVAQQARRENIPLIVLAGKMYGSGSSRDWAAKGPMLLGVRAVIAESFERIHRSNLIGMGVLPLQFKEGQNAASIGLDGTETFDIQPIDFSNGLPEPARVTVTAHTADGTDISFETVVRIDTATEGAYFSNGGILQYVVRNLARQ
ncbi:MAG: aconitate hydratase AcnA [Eggerthellaceae bacterium]|jgi:aconitate hydratase